jgi:hypothetical protein
MLHICGIQWNAFVELLPLWLAPNMVTLLGFFFILANVLLLVIFMPDLVGPVSTNPSPPFCLMNLRTTHE